MEDWLEDGGGESWGAVRDDWEKANHFNLSTHRTCTQRHETQFASDINKCKSVTAS